MGALRDDFSIALEGGGRHNLRVGGEWFRWDAKHFGWCNRCNGVLRITAPPPANVEQLFPTWNDASTWNLAALSPLVTNYEQSLGDHSIHDVRNIFAGWVQDDWALASRLTLNLGLRYDLDIGVL